MKRLLAAGMAAAVLTVTACADETPVAPQEETIMSQPRPSLDEAVDALESALDALASVLHVEIPAREWEKRGEGSARGCEARTQGRYDSARFLAASRYISPQTWGRIEQTLDGHGYRGTSAVPLEGGNTFVHFYNDFGDYITVSSIGADAYGDGGSGYFAKTSCHEGYVRVRDR